MALNFSFVIPGRLAGMERPGTYADLDEDMKLLGRHRIRAVVSLTRQPLDPQELALHNLKGLHLPVDDFQPPSQEQIRDFIKFVDENAPVAVHCGMGMGRTGTMLACYLVHTGESAEDAIRRVRESRPGSIETPQQEKAVAAFARAREKKL